LPTVRSDVVDATLYAIDLSVFHIEPAVAFDRFVSPATTEWFSFFYFGYFFVLAGHVLTFMFGARKTALLSELSLGIVLLFCIGHVLYIVVPGHGPYHHLANVFQHELDGPLWWRLVKTTVDSVEVSARTDIFPSLHTAAPTYLALFAFRHRKLAPFRFLWLPLALFSSQIVISTMFLRWHYLVDVVAGLLLALEVSIVGGRVARWEVRRREELGKSPVWTAPWEA
jgi:membrane-associated phospholipid phosphatase